MATKSDLVEAVANITGVSKAEANRAVDAVFTTITDNLVKGEDVRLTGFGSFSTAQRAARQGGTLAGSLEDNRPGGTNGDKE